jgi:protein-disulfide isomerase
LGPTFKNVMETPGMVLFKNGAYGDGPTTWVSLDPKAATMDMAITQKGLFGMLGRTEIPGMAFLAERVLEATPVRLDQLYSKAGPLSLRGDEPASGAKEGRFVVVEFLDFGCPHCAETSALLPQFLADNPDVSLLTKSFPLTGACNPGLQYAGDERCLAAIAAHCANQQGGFAAMAHALFTSDLSTFSPIVLSGMADKLGLDSGKINACAADPASRAHVEDDAKVGEAAGVDGTPSFFLKGAVADPGVWVRVDGRLEDVAALVAAARSGSKLPNP